MLTTDVKLLFVFVSCWLLGLELMLSEALQQTLFVRSNSSLELSAVLFSQSVRLHDT